MSDTSSSPIQKWKENIDTLNSALRSEAGKITCQSGSGTNSTLTDYVTRSNSLGSAVTLLKEVS
ncbi:MAG: hypothetical protein WCK88_00120 [bacterium]